MDYLVAEGLEGRNDWSIENYGAGQETEFISERFAGTLCEVCKAGDYWGGRSGWDVPPRHERETMKRTAYIKRSPIRRKPRKAKVTKSGRVILGAQGMRELRRLAFERAQTSPDYAICECHRIWGILEACGLPVTDEFGELHHIIFRSQGGSDTLENVAFIRRECHERAHGRKS